MTGVLRLYLSLSGSTTLYFYQEARQIAGSGRCGVYRLRTLMTDDIPCPTCQGAGLIRLDEEERRQVVEQAEATAEDRRNADRQRVLGAQQAVSRVAAKQRSEEEELRRQLRTARIEDKARQKTIEEEIADIRRQVTELQRRLDEKKTRTRRPAPDPSELVTGGQPAVRRPGPRTGT